MFFNRKFTEESDDDTRVLLEWLHLALFDFFQTYVVFVLLAWPRLRGWLISLLVCTGRYFHWKYNKVYVFWLDIWLGIWRWYSYSCPLIILGVIWVLVYPCHAFMFPFLSMSIPIYSVLRSKTEYRNETKSKLIDIRRHILANVNIGKKYRKNLSYTRIHAQKQRKVMERGFGKKGVVTCKQTQIVLKLTTFEDIAPYHMNSH